jgi:hypothetical protein
MDMGSVPTVDMTDDFTIRLNEQCGDTFADQSEVIQAEAFRFCDGEVIAQHREPFLIQRPEDGPGALSKFIKGYVPFRRSRVLLRTLGGGRINGWNCGDSVPGLESRGRGGRGG